MPALLARAVAGLVCALSLLACATPAASAHVVPTSTVQLDVGASAVEAEVAIPLSDVEAATDLDLGAQTQTDVDRQAAAITAYLLAHVAPTSDDGRAWTVHVGALTVSTTGGARTTGLYQQVETTLTLTPPAGTTAETETTLRSFDLGYTAIVDRVATHVIIVTLRSDVADPGGSPYELGVIDRDTVTDTVTGLHVDLGPGSRYRGFLAMVGLGVHHIREGTDHQLFLLTLLLPAPLLLRGRRYAGPAPGRRALRRITTITACFTLGHSLTLALGALGVPVAPGPVEALIAVSILVAAVHAVRPVFPGREAVVAAAFGLVHGLAFSETLRTLDLTGTRLVLALLGFNLGIELMQLAVVALVLPPLVVLARARAYRWLRTGAATATGIAALGWLAVRLGLDNPVATTGDLLGGLAGPVLLVLWCTALVMILTRWPAPFSCQWVSQRQRPARTGWWSWTEGDPDGYQEPPTHRLVPRGPAGQDRCDAR